MQHGAVPRFRWDDARILLALIRGRTLKGAGAALGVNATTVGRRLDAMEAGLGLRLFDRTPDGALPTAAAEQLLADAEGMERAAHDLVHALAGIETEPAGVVRLTAPPGVVTELLVPHLADLAARYPRLRLEVLSTVGYADLSRREADIALRALRPAAGDLVATRLAEVGSAPIASPEYARSLGQVRSLDEVRWTTWTEALAHLPDARWVLERVRPEQLVLRTDRMEAQLAAARAGLCALVTAAPYAGLPGLAPLRLSPDLEETLASIPLQQLWLVGHRALRDVPRIAAVWSWLVDRFAALRG